MIKSQRNNLKQQLTVSWISNFHVCMDRVWENRWRSFQLAENSKVVFFSLRVCFGNKWIGQIHPWKLRWDLKIRVRKIISLFQQVIFRFQPLIFQGVFWIQKLAAPFPPDWFKKTVNCPTPWFFFGKVKVMWVKDAWLHQEDILSGKKHHLSHSTL